MNWDSISDIILGSALLSLAVFAFLGLYQLLARRSLKKVDRVILFMLIPLTLMLATYLLFDKVFILNTRPNGSGEPSFPSTHVLVTGTIFSIIALALPKYLHKSGALVFLDSLMLILLVLTCIGRVASNMHWLSDVIGGLIFSAIFAFIYYLTIKGDKHE
ncbi:MAG: phosphatase PAP2 family protein [Candidatus Saccharibacteria bacterium]|nr:phosphatase PAP2 family protein [Candidatus Saccharibacteria bacterium]